MSKAEKQLPRHDGLFWPVVQALQNLGGSADNNQIVETVSDILQLADHLTAIPHNKGPQTEIAYRIAWVKTWLKWGNIVENPQRAVWVLTELGRKATSEDVEAVRLKLRSDPASRRKELVSAQEHFEPLSDDFQTQEFSEFEEDNWQSRLLSLIKEMPSDAFERLSRLLLLSLGFLKLRSLEEVGMVGSTC